MHHVLNCLPAEWPPFCLNGIVCSSLLSKATFRLRHALHRESSGAQPAGHQLLEPSGHSCSSSCSAASTVNDSVVGQQPQQQQQQQQRRPAPILVPPQGTPVQSE